MAWNPETYNQFKTERFAPFLDLLALIKVRPNLDVIDLGCGTGELTRKLADLLSGSRVLGIDASAEMLNDAKAFANEQVTFEQKSIETGIDMSAKWDVVFSNAAVQWVENHETLFPKIIANINPGGQLVVQMPAQHHNVTNQMLLQLSEEQPFQKELFGFRRLSPVLDIEDYARILFEYGGSEITVFEKIYPLVLQDADAVFDWTSGTALLPYVEKLEGEMQQRFIQEFKSKLKTKFPGSPAFYPFKRIIMSAIF
ncbi:methyltransferase domain-containing protein [Dyadobacter chenwenxiniae]|uniref:Methyltransferase domain-containing protein n=1 Tax=Dyadobacter chenwenxiniae TaxID=2906456 RepID=A0A9X1PKN9_9BACT|nr:methyltransferase domain-containing protein [Dyadobacter chenwenxiniae]MCF0062536.1 methyltransferase domain-containing protein [Dyadobacter chenwenxiniae]UON83720.1 methyltransferase domain-containing protein [Dyadobacter chenwenxiniae]